MSVPKIESIQYDPTTDTVDRYIRRKITGSSALYKASLDIMLCHMADFHQMTLEILCKKYDLDFEQVLKDIQEDETYREMMVHPLMNTLRYISEEELEKIQEEKPKKKKKFKIVKPVDDSEQSSKKEKNITISEYLTPKNKATKVTVEKN
jgi:hypothetical protein